MDDFEKAVHTVQFLAADGVERAASGHPGTPMALAGITVDLFTRHLRYDPRDPAWPRSARVFSSSATTAALRSGSRP